MGQLRIMNAFNFLILASWACRFEKAIEDYDRLVLFFLPLIISDRLNIALVFSVLRKHPDNLSGLFNRGVCYHRKKEYRKAIDDFSSLIELDNSNSIAFHNRAQAYECLGNNQRAASDYTISLKLQNDQRELV